MTALEKVFMACAVVGGVLFTIRLVLMMIGGDADMDADSDIGGGIDMDIDDGSHGAVHASPDGLNIFSLHGITSFFLVFGMSGLTCLRQFGLSGPLSTLLAFILGAMMMVSIAWVFAQLYKLRSDGNIKIQNAIGLEGTAYLRIPPDGTGKVQIIIQERMRIYDARSSSEDVIETGDRIRVVKILDESILSVEKIS
jgi:membrane protein implicated in regulation of membrane protease activity